MLDQFNERALTISIHLLSPSTPSIEMGLHVRQTPEAAGFVAILLIVNASSNLFCLQF